MNDDFDRDDFDPIAYINNRFPDEESLAGLDEEIARVTAEEERLDAEIIIEVREHGALNQQAHRELDGAQSLIQALLGEIRSIHHKAAESEAAVHEMCKDIKTLDIAKQNITQGINSLQKFSDLTDSLALLRRAMQEGSYAIATQALLSAADLAAFFRPFERVPPVTAVLEEKAAVERTLRLKLLDEFALYLRGMSSRPDSTLREACDVAEALGLEFRKEVVLAVVEHALHPYNELFGRREHKNLASLDRRFSWLEVSLTEFAAGRGKAFPAAWAVPCYIVHEFCGVTSVHFSEILAAPAQPDRVLALVAALKKTVLFEQDLQHRLQVEYGQFVGTEILRLRGALSRPFEAHMAPYIEQEDRDLREAVQRELQSDLDRREGLAESGEELGVLPSALVLFARIKALLDRAHKLSRGHTLLEVVRCARGAVTRYADQLRSYAVREEAHVRRSEKNERRFLFNAAVLLSTLDYVREMLGKLQPVARALVEEPFAHNIDFSEEETACQKIALEIISAVGRHFELRLESIFAAGPRTADARPFLELFTEAFRDRVPAVFYARVLKALAEAAHSRFAEALLRLKRLSSSSLEQLDREAQELQRQLLTLGQGVDIPTALFAFVAEHGNAQVRNLLRLFGASVEELSEMLKLAALSPADTQRALAVRGLRK